MLISSILFLLSSNAVTQRRDKSILYARIVITILVCCFILCLNSFHSMFFHHISSLSIPSIFFHHISSLSMPSMFFHHISSLSVPSIFFLLGCVSMIFDLMAVAGLLSVLGYRRVLSLICYSLNFFSLFIPAGCSLVLLPLLVLVEFISYLTINVWLGLRLVTNMILGHLVSLIYITYSFIHILYIKTYVLIYINPNILYIVILISINLSLRYSLFFNEDFLSNYILRMEGSGGTDPGGMPEGGASGTPGNAPQGSSPNQIHGTNQDATPITWQKEGWNTSHYIRVSIWQDMQSYVPKNDNCITYETVSLKVDIQPKTAGTSEVLTIQDGHGNHTQGKYIIASIGMFDVHINSERVDVFRTKTSHIIKTVDNPFHVGLSLMGSPVIRIGADADRYTWMGKNKEVFRKGLW